MQIKLDKQVMIFLTKKNYCFMNDKNKKALKSIFYRSEKNSKH